MLRSIIYLLAWPELFSMSRAIGSSLRKVCWYASGVPSKLFAHAASALLLLAAETSLLKQLQDVTVFRLKLSPQIKSSWRFVFILFLLCLPL